MTIRLAVVACMMLVSCVHTQRHDVRVDNGFAQIDRQGDLLVFTASWGDGFGVAGNRWDGMAFEFAKAPAVITYADGSKLEVWPHLVVKQFRQHPESKYLVKDGYHSLMTKKAWIYEIRKEKTTWGVRNMDYVATYDATPKEEPLELAQVYRLTPPESGYERRILDLSLTFPAKPMDIDIDIATVQLESQPVQRAHFHVHYTDKWEMIRIAP